MKHSATSEPDMVNKIAPRVRFKFGALGFKSRWQATPHARHNVRREK
jgi:hypothetical protein